MAFSSALWEAMSGTPWPYSQTIWKPNPTEERFMNIFAGIRPGRGTIDVSNYVNKEEAAHYYRSKGYNVVRDEPSTTTKTSLMDVAVKPQSAPKTQPKPIQLDKYVPPTIAVKQTPKQEIMESDIDNMLMKVHHLSMDKFPNETRWALARAKRKLQQLKPNERAFLRDPYIPEEEKENFLASVTALTSPEELQERWMRRQLDLAVRLGKNAKQQERRHFPMRPFEEGMFSPYNTETPGIEQARGYPSEEDLYTASPII